MAGFQSGRFLIASRHLRDSNFYKSVVLMIEHNAGGAMGLVVNHPSEISVSKALAGHFDLPESDDVVYTGGPVEESALFILHNSAEYGGAESPVVPGLYIGSNADVFERVVRDGAAGHSTLRYRIFAGCAGWAPHQLEGELSRGDWLTLPATLPDIFPDNPYDLWDALTKRAGPLLDLPDQLPPAAEWN